LPQALGRLSRFVFTRARPAKEEAVPWFWARLRVGEIDSLLLYRVVYYFDHTRIARLVSTLKLTEGLVDACDVGFADD
jgi:hypothetical protein